MDQHSTIEKALDQSLAAWGVPIFAPRPEKAFSALPIELLLKACLESKRSRYRLSLIPLFLVLPAEPIGSVLVDLLKTTDSRNKKWLRWLLLASLYLSRIYQSELTLLLGRRPGLPANFIELEELPGPEKDFGELGLRSLANEIARSEGGLIDWEGSLEAPVKDLLAALWAERNSIHARKSQSTTS